MNGTPSSPDNRRIRIFVSSTFRDMVEDRNELMTHAWPELRKFCRERQVELVEVDLRWGISQEQATRKETLKLCLDEIRACRPYFIDLLGQRYGWVPGAEVFTPDLLEEQPWLARLRDRSVTELEIIHGVLREEQMHGRAFFYFRDPAFVNTRPETNRTARNSPPRKLNPWPNANFVGREPVLASLRAALLNAPQRSPSGIHGVGGMGKAALAQAYAYHEAEAKWFDWKGTWRPLEPVQPRFAIRSG